MVTATTETPAASGTSTQAGSGKSAGRKPRAGNKPAAPKKERKQRVMTDEHKAAIVQGRADAKTVDRYLSALEQHKPKRGRKVTAESLQKRLEKIERDLLTATGVERLNLTQDQKDVRAALEATQATPENDIDTLKDEFVKVAAAYAARKGIHRSTFVDCGVPAPVLKEAGF